MNIWFSFSSSLLHSEAREADENSEGAFREGDGVLFQPAARLHQRSQSGRQHLGHVESTQLCTAVHTRRVCQGTGAHTQGHAERPFERGKTQLHQTQGRKQTPLVKMLWRMTRELQQVYAVTLWTAFLFLADKKWFCWVRRGQCSHGGRYLGGWPGPGQHRGGRILLPSAADHQEASGPASLIWCQENRRGGEAWAEGHPSVTWGLWLWL